MKKLIIALLTGTMILSLAACSSDSTSSEGESETTTSSEETKPVLKVGTSADYPPFEFHKSVDGKDTIVGVDIDLANYICDELGYELELVDMSFDGLIGGLKEGNFDVIISGFSVDPERDCDFSIPYYGADQVLITTKENKAELDTIEGLKGKKIAGLMGSVQETLAKEYAGDTAVAIQNFQDSVMMVSEGGLDGVICELGVADTVLASNDNLVISDAVIDAGDNSVAVAVKKGNSALLDEINPVLEDVLEQGLVSEWMEKYQDQ